MASKNKRGSDKRDADDTYEELSLSEVEVKILDDEDDVDDTDDTIVMEDEMGASFEVIPLVERQSLENPAPKLKRHSEEDRAERVTKVAKVTANEPKAKPKHEVKVSTTSHQVLQREYRIHGVPTTFFGRKEELKTLYNAIKQTVNEQALTIV